MIQLSAGPKRITAAELIAALQAIKPTAVLTLTEAVSADGYVGRIDIVIDHDWPQYVEFNPITRPVAPATPSACKPRRDPHR